MHDIIQDNHPGPADQENPGFRTWLDGGLAQLLPAARSARSLHDYQLVLHEYANGFADGHLGVRMTEQDDHLWPGFLVRAEAPNGSVRVSVLDNPPAGMALGDIVLGCNGTPIAQLLTDRILRPLLNPHVPQRLILASAWLMVTDADDLAGRWPSCTIIHAGKTGEVRLHWRAIAEPVLTRARMLSSQIEIPPIGLRRLGDVWMISLPTFYPQGGDVARMRAMIDWVGHVAGVLHVARHVVIDLRGNDGGSDEWGGRLAAGLWGGDEVDAVEAAMPSDVDWRVSARNEAALDAEAAMLRRQGQAEIALYLSKQAARMDAARKAGAVFMREAGDLAKPAPHFASPFAHPVYVLTTPHCASACLDVVDLLNGLPGTVRVGLRTSSDTDYLEIATAPLPSGHATLHYAMKVYRHRMRGKDVSYAPAIAWPGGVMDDAAIVRWVDTLP